MKTKEIKVKIKAVSNIKKITKTMEMVSVSKMRRAVDKALASRNYSKYALELLVNLSKDKDVSHPLMVHGKNNKELIIVIASNKGLCGGYHTNIFKALNAYLKTQAGNNKEIKAVTIGKYAEKICKKLNLPVFASFITFSEYSDINQTKDLSNLVMKEFIESPARNADSIATAGGGYNNVKILYTEFLKSTTYKPIIREIFPISIDTVKDVLETPDTQALPRSLGDTYVSDNMVNYAFEPDLNLILDSILPGLVDVVIYQTLAEAYASEHSARMFAMKNAGDNATTILDALMLSYNHARQDGITKELSEIVAGAEALNVN